MGRIQHWEDHVLEVHGASAHVGTPAVLGTLGAQETLLPFHK